VDNTEVQSRSAGVHERDHTSRERDRSQAIPTVHKGIEDKGKGKSKAYIAEPISAPDAEPEISRRGRSYSRAQTPGPLSRAQSSNKRPGSGEGSSSNRRGRSRSVGVAGHRT
jgi:hypothetical protein